MWKQKICLDLIQVQKFWLLDLNFNCIVGVSFVNFGDLEVIREIVVGKIVVVFVEFLQGEGGICFVIVFFFRGFCEFCDEIGIFFVFDEVYVEFCLINIC